MFRRKELPKIFYQIKHMDVSRMGKLKQNQCIPLEDVFKSIPRYDSFLVGGWYGTQDIAY
jgi:hypothetical protein